MVETQASLVLVPCLSCVCLRWTLCSSASRGGWPRPRTRPRPASVMGVVLDLGQRDQIRTRGLGFETNLKQEAWCKIFILSLQNNIFNIKGTHLALSLKGYGIVEGVASGCGAHVEAGGGGQHARVERGEGRARLAGVAPAAAPHGAVRALVPQVLGKLLVEPGNITINTVLLVTSHHVCTHLWSMSPWPYGSSLSA